MSAPGAWNWIIVDAGRNSAPERRFVDQSQLKLADIFLAVKTSGKFHKTRLALLMETWIARTKTHVS